MALNTPQYPETLALATNSTATAWGTLAGETSLPSGLTNVPGPCDNLFIQPFGTGADNATLDFRVVGVSRIVNPAGGQEFRRYVLAQFSATLSADVGESGRIVDNNERYADTITQTFGVAGNGAVSPGSDIRGYAMVDLAGVEFFYVEFKRGSATAANAVLRLL